MRFEAAVASKPIHSSHADSFSISSALPFSGVMPAISTALRPVIAGLLLTLLQLGFAVWIFAPEGPLSHRYSTLVQHDGYWFTNIVDRGYQTTMPPINFKMMEVSNVAFFPAYPALAGALRYVFNLATDHALLITAQAAAWGFWTYFFLFCRRWNISPLLQAFGALSIFAHPAAFFLVAGYSESMFLMALFGFIYWSTEDTPRARIWAALHGIVMSGTRIVGIICTGFPVVYQVVAKGCAGLQDYRRWIPNYGGAIALTSIATLGAGAFFLYCQLRWGHWDTYLLTQQLGWNIIPDYLAVFKPSSYRFHVPALNNPVEMSQMAMTFGALIFVAIAIIEALPSVRVRGDFPLRAAIYFLAAVIYYISVSGVATIQMESMLRYQFCTHALIVLAILHFLRSIRRPSVLVRRFAMAAVALLSAAGLGVQGWYVWNFTRGNWVA